MKKKCKEEGTPVCQWILLTLNYQSTRNTFEGLIQYSNLSGSQLHRFGDMSYYSLFQGEFKVK